MKQLLFLLLFPVFAVAQYPANANQKITLGEQTTADGLVYRGLASDTTRKPSVDTMAYILLDTNTNIIWQYKKATSNAWTRVGGSISSGLTGVLPVANGGTNVSSLTSSGVLYANSTSQVATTSNLTYDGTMLKLISTASGGVSGSQPNPTYPFRLINSPTAGQGSYNVFDMRMERNGTENRHPNFSFSTDATNGEFYNIAQIGVVANQGSGNLIKGNLLFFTKPEDAAPTERVRIRYDGNVGIGTDSPTEKLHVDGSARITGAYDNTDGNAANVYVTSTGVLKRSTASSIRYKKDVEDYTKGINEVMKMRPVTFKMINSNGEKIFPGFIAEELKDLNLNELLQNNDEDEPDAVNYPYIVTLLTKAIQEQQQQIENLKKRLLTLENK